MHDLVVAIDACQSCLIGHLSTTFVWFCGVLNENMHLFRTVQQYAAVPSIFGGLLLVLIACVFARRMNASRRVVWMFVVYAAVCAIVQSIAAFFLTTNCLDQNGTEKTVNMTLDPVHQV